MLAAVLEVGTYNLPHLSGRRVDLDRALEKRHCVWDGVGWES